MGAALDAVKAYADAFENRQKEWKDLVTDDVTLAGPLQCASGRKEFIALTEQFLQIHRKTRVLKRIEDGDSVCSICECVVNAPSGKQLTFQYAEWARVAKGRVAEFRLYYDPREFARAFGLREVS